VHGGIWHGRICTIVAANIVGAVCATSALAADLTAATPVYKAPIYLKAPVAPAWSWTGFYVGGDVGAQWTDPTWTATSLRDPPGPCPSGTQLPIDGTSPGGFDSVAARFGAFAGYNWQFAPTWVVGIEGDYGYANIKTTKPGFPGCSNSGCVAGFVYVPGGGPDGGDNTAVTVGWDASALGRLGYLVTPDVLVFGTGGASWQNVQATGNCGPWQTSLYCNGPGQPSPSSVTQTTTLPGWTIGAGAEWHAWGNWLLRGEYRFSDFGTWTSVFPFGSTTAGGDNTYRFQLKLQTQTAYLGLAYKF
jgi:outer membrane immunogenic protein